MDGLRIDKWLWFARFCKSRSLAQHLIDEGAVKLNNRPIDKVSTTVREGDELTFRQGRGWRRVMVTGIGSRRGSTSEAQALYQELAAPDPPPDDWA
ncbi:RNA-binding S4 domain-containing protein [Telmatospirillum sp.]|uniref:RNA-binding S4 domain-containing protein n=1 Tax=Telmatospirillum sp. TaxID=2079197 RepID=UPI00284350A4|nr:RNA-binding S4 domain-containing protein [Telmatospirillum sp.]MDR3436332.1 RNA-binding S4 domain-containing protein [Telmatospirillum sp.]